MSLRQPNRKRLALANWWMRRIFQFVLAILACFFLMLSLARVLNVDTVNWPAMALWIISNYNIILFKIGNFFIKIVSNFPSWLFDIITIYLLIGALMRISIRDIALYSEKKYYDDPIDTWDDEFHKDGIASAKNAGKIESSRFYILWPVRFYSDLKKKIYWQLTPMWIFIYSLFIIISLVSLSYI